jgi:hypothetical protein
MVKICSDSDFKLTHVTPRGGRQLPSPWLKLETNNLHSSHGPDQQLQRRQRVYRHPGVQQALVLVQN